MSVKPCIRVCTALVLASWYMVVSAAEYEVRPVAADGPQGTVSYDTGTNTYVLSSGQGVQVTEYFVDIDHPDVQAGMLRVLASVSGGQKMVVISKAGTRYRDSSGNVLEPADYEPGANTVLSSHRIEGNALVMVFTERPGADSLSKTYRLSVVGRSLMIEFTSDSTRGLDGYAGVSLGYAEVSSGQAAWLAYMPEPVGLLPGGLVLTAFLDPWNSSSSGLSRSFGASGDGKLYSHARSIYYADTSHRVPALHERAWITVSKEISDVFPRVSGPPSPYRHELSSRLVLDVWGMHRNFDIGEGVALLWEAEQAGMYHVSVTYADQNSACGDGVVLEVKREGELLARIAVPNGQTEEKVWNREVPMEHAQRLAFRVNRAGNNACDATRLKAVVQGPGGTYDSEADFSSVQGYRGFYYMECQADTCTPMTYDQADSRWKGSGAYSLIWRGGMHPGQGRTALLDAQNMIERYFEYGMRDLAIIFHVWQRWGYDQGLPDHHPVNPDLGTGAQMKALVDLAKNKGMLFALHENYTDMYPDNPPDYPSPLWDESAVALDPNGDRKLGWYQPSTKQQAYVIASARMHDFSAMESSSIASDYGPNAAYLDVSTGWTPARSIDFNPATGVPHTLSRAAADMAGLFEYMKGLYGGPMFGEGGEGEGSFDSYFAGVVDAVERQVVGRFMCNVAPDYELLVVKPRMMNHGMGYYPRYFVPAGHVPLSVTDADLDQYRATEIAFGHAGFLGDLLDGMKDWVTVHAPEYWLMQALQERYGDAGLTAVEYLDGFGFTSLEDALRKGLDLSEARIRIRYDNGLVIYVNRNGPKGMAASFSGFSHVQGGNGWTYYEDTGSGPVAMHWDPEQGMWKGSGKYSLLTKYGGHPDGGSVVRVFTASRGGIYHLKAAAGDMDTSCGDGVRAVLSHNGNGLWTCDMAGDVEDPCGVHESDLQVSAGDTIEMVIDQKANNWCDSTRFTLELSWMDSDGHDWVVTSNNQSIRLPPAGFAASDNKGFVAYTARPDTGTGSGVVDLVESDGYDFARSRDNTMRTVGRYRLDGALAVVLSQPGPEIHALALTQAYQGQDLILKLSDRADLNFNLLDQTRAALTLRNVEGKASANLTLGLFPESWRTAIDAGSHKVQVSMSDGDGNSVSTPVDVTVDQDRNLLLQGLQQDVTYLVELVPVPGELVGDMNEREADADLYEASYEEEPGRELDVRPEAGEQGDADMFEPESEADAGALADLEEGVGVDSDSRRDRPWTEHKEKYADMYESAEQTSDIEVQEQGGGREPGGGCGCSSNNHGSSWSLLIVSLLLAATRRSGNRAGHGA